MRYRGFLVSMLLSGLVGIAGLCRDCHADMLYRHDGSPPMVGTFVRETERQIVFLEHFRSGATKEQTLFKADVLRLIRTIDKERLKNLNPESPATYYEYAEELAGYKLDFVAQQLAVRLFLIAARHSTEQVRQSSLLALHALFSDEIKRRRTRALALLTLPSRYQHPFLKTRTESSLKSEVRDQLLAIVKQIRNGKRSDAAVALKSDSMRAAMSRFTRIATWDAVYRIAISGEPKMEQMLILVKLELALRADELQQQQEPEGFRWFQDVQRKDSFATEWVTFENLTRFDPGLSVFRDGKWVKPGR